VPEDGWLLLFGLSSHNQQTASPISIPSASAARLKEDTVTLGHLSWQYQCYAIYIITYLKPLASCLILLFMNTKGCFRRVLASPLCISNLLIPPAIDGLQLLMHLSTMDDMINH